jgi:endopolyphosphatase
LLTSDPDIHPDPFYKVGSSPEGEHPCHRGSGKGSAGYYGAETTDCDTPFSLVNATFDWINDYVKDEVDFVVWTGDSARHDNDEQYPRSDGSVVDLNRFIVHKFVEVFGKTDNIDDPDPTNDFVIPIVPTFGNNDILPHNIFEPGPNKWTKKYEDIWRRFVPQEQRHSFARGGWFFTEVIPNKLAIFSLNTLYFFDSNSAVDGCDAKSEPGYEHMEWLRIQLQFLRERGMKAILIGHVPPARTESKQSWDETCYQKYTLWLRQYRDIILTTIYGHMNIDHFMFQDVKELKYKFLIDGVDEDFERANESAGGDTELEFTIAQKAVYLNELREGWADLPKPPKGSSYTNLDDGDVDMVRKKKKGKGDQMMDFLESIGGPYGERYSVSLVSPSVVPNFFPTLRVVEYNITGLEDVSPAVGAIGKPATAGDILENFDFESEEDVVVDAEMKELEIEKKKKKKKKKKGKKKSKRPNFHVPAPPSSTAPPGPAYSPQTLSLLSWKQYYANLTEIHENLVLSDIGSTSKSKDKHFRYQLEYQTNNDSWYQMQDLTVRSWLDVAEKLGRAEYQKADAGEAEVEKKKHKKKKKKEKDLSKEKNPVWRMWIARVFVMSKSDEELDDDF